MKKELLKKYIGVFILAACIIAVYKTFDSIGAVFGYIGSFFKLIIPIFLAFAIAFILHPACKKLEVAFKSLKIKFIASHCRGAAITTIYLGALAIITGFFWILLPILFESISDLVKHLPVIIEKVGKFLYSTDIAGYSLKPLLDRITIYDIISVFDLSNVQSVMQSLLGFSKSIINFVLAIIISIYILSDRAGLLNTLNKLSALVMRGEKKAVLTKYVNRTFFIMYRYIYCQLLDAVIVFVISFISLSILKVQYAPVLAMFVGVFNLVPYFGAVVACTLSALLTVFTASFSKGLVVAVVLIVLQQLDANLIQPRLVRDTLKVKPFWVLCGILIGGGLFGMIGILLAVPAIALVKTIFDDIYDYRTHHIESEDKAKVSK